MPRPRAELVDRYRKSFQVNKFDYFISHCWQDERFPKALVLEELGDLQLVKVTRDARDTRDTRGTRDLVTGGCPIHPQESARCNDLFDHCGGLIYTGYWWCCFEDAPKWSDMNFDVEGWAVKEVGDQSVNQNVITWPYFQRIGVFCPECVAKGSRLSPLSLRARGLSLLRLTMLNLLQPSVAACIQIPLATPYRI